MRHKIHMAGLTLGAIYLAVLLVTSPDQGYSRDEGFYFSAARLYQGWFDRLFEDPAEAVRSPEIYNGWKYNYEHPALMKILFGFSHRIFHKKLDWLSSATSYRLPGMITASLLIYLVFVFGTSIFGMQAGFFAAVSLALMPRFFYHAHTACFDVAITFFWTLTMYLLWKSYSSLKFGLAAGLVFGLTLCTKLNAFFLPFLAIAHYAGLLIYRLLKRKAGEKLILPKPYAFIFGLIFAPVIFFAHWPWLWYDTWPRLMKYVGFHSNHPFYNTAWLGENIIEAPTPISLPVGMTFITIPTIIIILSLAGILLRTRHHLPQKLDTKLKGILSKKGTNSRDGLDALLFINLIFPIALISLPFIPIFGGTKHWMPSFPFIALFAGCAISAISTSIKINAKPGLTKTVQICLILFLLVPSAQQTITSHPFGLASYVPLIGGAKGAANLGMTRQFWGYTTTDVLPYINKNVPHRKRVFFHDTAAPSVRMFKEEGQLRKDIRISGLKHSDFALLHHELHMRVEEAWICNAYKNHYPVHVLTYQGVPIISIYKR